MYQRYTGFFLTAPHRSVPDDEDSLLPYRPRIQPAVAASTNPEEAAEETNKGIADRVAGTAKDVRKKEKDKGEREVDEVVEEKE